MDEPPGVRLRVALAALTMAEYFRDVKNQDVLLFVDNIFRFVQAGSEVSTLLGRMPSAVGTNPHWPTRWANSKSASLRRAAARSPHCRRSTCRPTTTPTRAVHDVHHLTPRPSSVVRSPARYLPGRRPLTSTSNILPRDRGERHYAVARQTSRSCSATKSCRTSSRSWPRRTVEEDASR